jgi:hypothetical protein
MDFQKHRCLFHKNGIAYKQPKIFIKQNKLIDFKNYVYRNKNNILFWNWDNLSNTNQRSHTLYEWLSSFSNSKHRWPNCRTCGLGKEKRKHHLKGSPQYSIFRCIIKLLSPSSPQKLYHYPLNLGFILIKHNTFYFKLSKTA